MPFPENIPHRGLEPAGSHEACDLAESWRIHPSLALSLIAAQAELPFRLWIFSGARSRGLQERISHTPFELSTHADTDSRGCPRPSTGADVQPVDPGIRLSGPAVAQMGAAFTRAGLRWGGGADVGPDGIPVGDERWHVDLGPRRAIE